MSVTIGGATGAIGGKGANGAELSGVYKKSTNVLKTAVSPKKIAQYKAKMVKVIDKTIYSITRTIAAGALNSYSKYKYFNYRSNTIRGYFQ